MKAKITKTLIKTLKPATKEYEVNDTEQKGFRIRVFPSGKMTYVYSYYNQDGKRKRIKIGSTCSIALEGARDKATEYANDVAKGIDVQASKQDHRGKALHRHSYTLERYLVEVYDDWAAVQLKGRISQRIRVAFYSLLHRPIADLTILVIENWRIAAIKQGKKNSTINVDVTILGGALNKAVKWGYIEANPFKGITPLAEESTDVIRYLSDEEKARFWSALFARDQAKKQSRTIRNRRRLKEGSAVLPDLSALTYADRLTPMILVSMHTGIRKSECCSLCWSEVDFKKRELTILASKAKSKKTRVIPMNDTVYEVLSQWRGQHPDTPTCSPVFLSKNGKPTTSMYTAFKGLIEQAKIVNFRWHDMRHDFATTLVKQNVNLNLIKDLLGHSDYKTTLRYAKVKKDSIKQAVLTLDNANIHHTMNKEVFTPINNDH